MSTRQQPQKQTSLVSVLAILVIVIVVINIIVCLFRRWQDTRRSLCSGTHEQDSNFSSGRFKTRTMNDKFKIGEQIPAWVGKGRRHKHDESCSDSSSSESCHDCLAGGLDASCSSNDDCACGLKCQSKKCACPKPSPPQLRIQVSENGITVTWPPVADADYYDLYLVNQNGNVIAIQLFLNQTVHTFTDVPPGQYYVYAFSGSSKCGMVPQFSQTETIDFQLV